MGSGLRWLSLPLLLVPFACEDDPPFAGPPLTDHWEERGDPAMPDPPDEPEADPGTDPLLAATDTAEEAEPADPDRPNALASGRSGDEAEHERAAETESESDAGTRPDARAPQTVAQGTLFVVTPGGWANVYDDDDDFLGQTPLRTPYRAGIARLRLRPFGNPPDRNVRVQIRPNETSRVELRVSGDPPR